MNNVLLKELFKFKLKTIESISNRLPPSMGDSIKNIQNQFIEVINQATGEYLEEKKTGICETVIKKVTVE